MGFQNGPQHENLNGKLAGPTTDMDIADTVIAFTEKPRSTSSRGGRHCEWGAAIASGHKLICVGGAENIFYGLPGVEHFDTSQTSTVT